jgi:hypothetical protein
MDWGEDTMGAEAQTDSNLNDAQFKPLAMKRGGKNPSPGPSAETMSGHVNNILATYDAVTPEQKHAGARFYPQAHRAASAIAQGIAPGVLGAGQAQTRASKRGVYRPPGVSKDDVNRAAAKIAVLSPSMPAGMAWRENAQAAHDIAGVSGDTIAKLGVAHQALQTQQHAQGLLKSLKGTRKSPGTGSRAEIKAAAAVHAAARSDYADKAAIARAPLEGTQLVHAGIVSILRAHDVHTGASTPEQALPMKNKTGAFYENIADPAHSNRAVIDGRSHDIAHGATLGWTTNRGLSAAGRYSHFEQAHQQAATARGVSPMTMQATTWIADKEHAMSKGTPANQAINQSPSRNGNTPLGQ